ncbi:major glycerophosphoinositol permease Git3p [[Candida] railenensis]|uniref:Major glycerophosphoinositol permease Git3p n=1 Tax=[Candida] railenensis TaxID=45579 RepID=A0A9P0QLD7_9ASCO|nr:major glycerophosphoinositol permease Git3p [[Candida] railenensis]
MSTRDLPSSVPDLFIGWTKHIPGEITIGKSPTQLEEKTRADHPNRLDTEEIVTKTKVGKLWPAFTSGAGLFSDGYVNSSMGTALAIIKQKYPEQAAKSNAISNIASIAFAGTVVGMLFFGWVSDRISRKNGMLFVNIMLIAFTLLTAVGTWGANGSVQGLFTSLTVFRFFLGIFIGAEYPTSSVISAEFANQLPAGHRNRYFCWFTNGMIDMGFIVSAFVPLVLLWIFSERHLSVIWRLTLGLGAIPPFILFFLRLKITEGDAFEKLNFNRKGVRVPYWLIVKFYWFRLLIVSLIWFIYDFSAYSFGIYSSTIISGIIPDGDIYKTYGWTTVLYLFYIPGFFLGALSADYIGPRLTLALGTGLQGIVGFIMAALYEHLSKHVGAFIAVYGIFTALGEYGPGDNIGLLASKTSATPIRGQYYGIAAAIGKIGAFVGTYIFPIIIKNAGGDETVRGNQMPFYVSSALCIFSALLAIFFCPSVGQDAINKEDEDFINYLNDNGFDINLLGNGTILEETLATESSFEEAAQKSSGVIVETKDKSI